MADFSAMKAYAQRNWFQLLLLALGLYIIMVKDINFQLSMNNAQSSEESTIPADFWEREMQLKGEEATQKKSTAFSMISAMITGGDLLGRSKALPEKAASVAVVKRDVPTKAEKVAVKKNLANTFSNLTFVLSPTYAKRKNIPEELVAEKVAKCQAYLQRFAPVAVAEMKKYGIPASITLAQGLLESNVGDSRLTKANNNHFGIKCFSQKCKKGHCSNFTDDTHKDFFRVYQSAWESYRAHSAFLQGKRYIHLKKLGATNYKAWANGLYKAGYATDKRYAAKLIQIIEFLKLNEYDE